MTGKLADAGVTRVQINGEECTDRTAIETTLLKVNEDKVHASEHTAFLQPPLVTEFGFQDKDDAGKAVLQGEYQAPIGTDEYAEALLQELGCQELPRKGPYYAPCATVSTEDHIAGWKKAKERTSAGLSGLHFGMYKAHIKRRKLAELDASMRSVAYITGYSYTRWKRGLDVQLLKRS